MQYNGLTVNDTYLCPSVNNQTQTCFEQRGKGKIVPAFMSDYSWSEIL